MTTRVKPYLNHLLNHLRQNPKPMYTLRTDSTNTMYPFITSMTYFLLLFLLY